jgi:Cyclophilin type peptidyl-prolyl cis-trans isomerase/CLD
VAALHSMDVSWRMKSWIRCSTTGEAELRWSARCSAKAITLSYRSQPRSRWCRVALSHPPVSFSPPPLLPVPPSQANRGPNTAGSQFFICYAACPHLNSVNTVFAQVIDGMETLDAMERTAVDKKDRPIQPIVLHRIILHANPIAQLEHNSGTGV